MLNQSQSRAAFNLDGNILVEASPGSGKTRTLVARAENQLNYIPPFKKLVLITYTNAAADEIADRLSNNSTIFIGTIHRFCLEFILRPYSWLFKWGQPHIRNFEDAQDFLDENREVTNQITIEDLDCIKRGLNGSLDIVCERKWGKVRANELATRYFKFLEDRNLIDFNEILYRTLIILENHQFVAKALANSIQEILIDEYQDTNYFQFRIFNCIRENGEVTFFMVGDKRQMIFRFAGAWEKVFDRTIEDFSPKQEFLSMVYRSSDVIVNGFCKLFPDHPKLNNDNENKDFNFYIKILKSNSKVKNQHKELLCKEIRYLINKDVRLSEIAILCPTWNACFNCCRELRTDYPVVGIGALPHQIRSLDRLNFDLLRSLIIFVYSPTVSHLNAATRAFSFYSIANAMEIDDVKKHNIINRLIFDIKNIDNSCSLKEGFDRLKDIFNDRLNGSVDIFTQILGMINPDELPFWTLEKYFSVLSKQSGITINTIYQAKGLEYDAVIIDDCSRPRIPYHKWNSSTRSHLEPSEEVYEDGRRLMYVAMSRARKYLFINYDSYFGPSCFINDVLN